MRSIHLALALSPLVAFAACDTDRDFTRSLTISNAETITFCVTPEDELPLNVGDFQVQVFGGPLEDLDPDTVTVEFTSILTSADTPPGQGHTPLPTVTLSVASGSQIPLGSTTVDVLVESPRFRRIEVEFLVEVVGRRADDRSLVVRGFRGDFSIINTCPPAQPLATQPQFLIEQILGEEITSDFTRFSTDAPVGVPTLNQDPSIEPRIPEEGYAETFQVGSLVTELTQDQLDAAFLGTEPLFPANVEGEFGLTIPSIIAAPMVPGEYLFAWQCVQEDIPLDGDLFFRPALTLDRDNDESNNFRAMEPLTNDPFDNSDVWYQPTYDPISGWLFLVLDAETFPPTTPMSAARVIFWRQVQLFIIPVSEFAAVDRIGGRFSTFAHSGDLGRIDPWSADATPPVGEPLLPITLRPRNL